MKKALFNLFISSILALSVSFYTAFVFMKLFNWFIPQLTNINQISYGLSYGICVIIGFLKIKVDLDTDTEGTEHSLKDILSMQFVKIVLYSVFLLIGFIVFVIILGR